MEVRGAMCPRFVAGKLFTKQDIDAHMKRHEGWSHLDSIYPYSHPKEIEENENGSEDDDVVDEDIADEDIADEDFDVGPKTDLSALMTLLISLR
ncbi:hypothetical protein ZTR_09869 [Talaromyces verruculosus]|nr:hypothetical protein ZTR_09869 [Talaromyces verruculosus]